jgi:hypothetical protein
MTTGGRKNVAAPGRGKIPTSAHPTWSSRSRNAGKVRPADLVDHLLASMDGEERWLRSIGREHHDPEEGPLTW